MEEVLIDDGMVFDFDIEYLTRFINDEYMIMRNRFCN